MRSFVKNLAIVFAAGCLGGLANSVAIWLAGHFHLTSKLGVSMAPDITPHWLYPRIVWGGIWGLLFLLPFFKKSVLLQIIMWSLPLTIVQLLIVYPFQQNLGFFGSHLGDLTFIFIFVANLIWAIFAAATIRIAGAK